MKTLNEQYGITSKWKLRLKYYAGYGTYLEAYSNIKRCWLVLMRINLRNTA